MRSNIDAEPPLVGKGINRLMRLQIHQQPRASVLIAKRILARLIDLDEVFLGGGTTLEARWHHRESTDLDFFSTGEAVDTLFYRDQQKLESVLKEFGDLGLISDRNVVRLDSAVLHFQIGHTPVSLGRTDEIHGFSDEVEHESGIRLSSTEDILTKKLYNRLCLNGLATERDAYDFVVARTFDPKSLAYAWDYIGGVHRENVKLHLDSVIENPLEEGEGRRVRAPAYPLLSENVWTEVSKLFQSDLEYMPKLVPSEES